jgi:hypothetical protein
MPSSSFVNVNGKRHANESGNERRFTRYGSRMSKTLRGNGASLGKEAVVAASGLTGEKRDMFSILPESGKVILACFKQV